MIFIEHRKNSIADLKSSNSSNGVEMDLRSRIDRKGELVVTHDAFSQGDTFDEWFEVFINLKMQGPLVLNVKEDQLEELLIDKMKSKNIENYLFLDSTFPSFMKLRKMKMAHKCMLRISKFESIETVLPFVGEVEWLWVDCFDGMPTDIQLLQRVASTFKLCMVSPELQGHSLETNIDRFLPQAFLFSAICTKNWSLWKERLK